MFWFDAARNLSSVCAVSRIPSVSHCTCLDVWTLCNISSFVQLDSVCAVCRISRVSMFGSCAVGFGLSGVTRCSFSAPV